MKKKLFVLILSIFIALPFAMLFSGCDEQDFIGISAQNSRQKIDYGQEFNPVEKFNIRSHYLNGKVEQLGEQDLTYTITKDEEIYILEDTFDCGFYTFEFSYNDSTCKAYLTVNKIDYTENDVVEIENFAVNRAVSIPRLNTISDGNVNFYYKHANRPTEQENLWLYEEGDINENINPGDYIIYAKVDEGTNYKSYKTENTPFHVSPEPLDESYSITTSTLTTTFNFGSTLNDYTTELNETVKLQKLNEETGLNEVVEGSFSWASPTEKISVADSGNKHYILFVSENTELSGKEFEITFNLETLKITRPVLTLNSDETTLQSTVMYDGEEHPVYFGTDYTVQYVEDTVRILKDEKIIITSSGTFSSTDSGHFNLVETLVDPINTCWDNDETGEISFAWSITPVPFNYGDIYAKINKNAIMVESSNGNIIAGKIVRTKLNDVVYIKYNEFISLPGNCFGFMGLVYKDETTGNYNDLPEPFTFSFSYDDIQSYDMIVRDLCVVEKESDTLLIEDGVIQNEIVGKYYIPNGYNADDIQYPITMLFSSQITGDENHVAENKTYSFTVILTN